MQRLALGWLALSEAQPSPHLIIWRALETEIPGKAEPAEAALSSSKEEKMIPEKRSMVPLRSWGVEQALVMLCEGTL